MDHEIQRYEPLFGSWYVKEKLNQGSTGQLFRIHKVDALGNDCFSALKVIGIPSGGENEIRSILASGVSEEEMVSYFQGVIENASTEFGILSTLKGNSNIVSYEDHEIIKRDDTIGWDILIRMEEITPLLDYSLDHELTEDDVLKMGIDVCRGLSLCARHKIIHRDIKPENIFVSDNGDFKIGDFGIARIVEQTQTYLSRKGTYTYMAPEMFRGDPYTENVDLYSLGLVMYRYLNNGRGPFMPKYPEHIVYEDNEQAFTKRVSGYEIPQPANGSPRLKEIVLKACAYDSKDRYAAAEEMLDDLEELREMGRQTQRMEKRLSKLPRYKRRLYRFFGRRKRALLIGILSLFICCAVAFAFIPKDVTSIEGIDEETTLLIGDTLSPEYTVKPFWFRDSEIHFASSDEEVFTVDQRGRIIAVGTGSGVMTMTSRSYTDNVRIQVDPKVTKIGNVSDLSLYTGDSSTLKPSLSPEKYKDEPITYRSSDASVATVSEKGKVTAAKAGGATITIESGGAVKNLNVIVMDPPQPSVSNTSGNSSGKSSGSSGKSSSGSSGKSSSGGSKKSDGGDYFDDDEFF